MTDKKKKTGVATKTKATKTGQDTDTRSRVTRIKQTQREEVRKKMKGLEYVRQLELCMEQLSSEYKKLSNTKMIALANKDVIDLRIRIIREKINLNIRRLKFVLPELKAIELTDADGDNPFAKLGAVISELTKGLSDNQ